MPEPTELERYHQMTTRSRAAWENAKQHLPGGDSRTSIFWAPYPVFADHGEGCRLWDLDGTERLDFANSMTSLILGHADPQVVAAVQEQATKGLVYNAPNEHQVELARLLCERIPSFDMARFTNSGTEATMNTLRGARAFTGRTKYAKAEGGYHGTHNDVEVNVRTDPTLAGDPQRPQPVPGVAGLPPEVVDQVLILPYNDTESTRRLLEEHRGELAAVMVEPVLGGSGMIPADPEYLAMLRDYTTSDGSVLIFDEVISYRVAPGGSQEYYGVIPDMTALGKIIGGGMAVGAFGGRHDIMAQFDPTQGPKVDHSGTFNANPMTMVAGATTLRQLQPETYTRLAELTERARQGLRDVAAELEVPLQVTGLGSLFGVHFTSDPIRNYRDVYASNRELRQRVFWGLMNEGIFCSPNLVLCLSTPMGGNEIDTFVEAFHKVLARNLPG